MVWVPSEVAWERLLGGSYELINEVLGGIELDIVPELEPIDISVGTIEVRSVSCKRLGLTDVEISSTQVAAPEVVDGEEYERIDLAVKFVGVRIYCKVPICTDTWFSSRNCGGYVTMTSDASSGSSITLKTMVLSKNFTKFPATIAKEIAQAPRTKIKLDNVKFDGKNFLKVIGINLSGAVVGAINSLPAANDAVLDPIAEEIDVLLKDVMVSVNALILDNPIANVELFGDATSAAFEADARRSEATLVRNLGNRLDLKDNMLTDFIFDQVGDKKVLDITGVLDVAGGMPESIEPIVNAVFGRPGSALNNFDVLGAINSVQEQDPSAIMSFVIDIEGVGSVGLSIERAVLSSSPPANLEDLGILIEILSGSTISVPQLESGDLKLEATVGINVSIDTELFEEKIAFQTADSGTVTVEIIGLIARLAVLFAVGEEEFWDMQVGPIVDDPLGCITSSFMLEPTVTAAKLDTATFTVQSGGFSNGLFVLASDLVNNVLKIYEAAIPEFAASQLVDVTLLEVGQCPKVVQTSENMATPYNFTQGIVRTISDAVSPDTVNSMLSDLQVDVEGEPVARVVTGPAPVLDLEVPLSDGDQVQISLVFFDIRNAFPSLINELKLLKATPISPQLLENEVDASSPDSPVELALRLVLQERDGEGILVQDNDITVKLALDKLLIELDILAPFSVYGFNSLPLWMILQPECMMSRLGPEGGFQKALVFLEGLDFAIICNQCKDNPMLQEWSNAFKNPQASRDLENVLNGFLGEILDGLVSTFNSNSVDSSSLSCNEAQRQQRSSSAEGTTEPITRTLAAAGCFFLLLGLALVCTCRCRVGRQPPLSTRTIQLPKGVDVGASQVEREALERDEMLKETPLYRHARVPLRSRLLIPVLLLVNFGLFLVGHLGPVIDFGLTASVLGLPIDIESFGTFSVLSTTLQLFKAGSAALATLLFLMSVLWPYVKVVGMALAWFMPGSWLSFKRRDNIITVLDQLGKWSLVELFFVAYVLILLNVVITSPTSVSYLPQENYAWNLELLLDPQASLFAFITALILSLLISNIIFVYQKRVKHEACHEFQSSSDLPVDKAIALTDLTYLTFDKKGQLQFTLKVTQRGKLAIILSMLFCMALLVAAGALPILEVETVGVVKPLIDLSGGETKTELSVVSLMALAVSNADAMRVYFVVVFFATVVIIPLLQMATLIYMTSSTFTLKSAILFQERNGLLSAWCATEVFVLAAVFTVLELEQATRGLVSDECDFITPLVEPLLAVQLIDERDAGASCFALVSRVDSGLIAFLVLTLVTQLVHVGVTKLFKAYIETRKGRFSQATDHGRASGCCNVYSVLASLGLITLTPQIPSQFQIGLPELKGPDVVKA